MNIAAAIKTIRARFRTTNIYYSFTEIPPYKIFRYRSESGKDFWSIKTLEKQTELVIVWLTNLALADEEILRIFASDYSRRQGVPSELVQCNPPRRHTPFEVYNKPLPESVLTILQGLNTP